jgi:hypothetical protein
VIFLSGSIRPNLKHSRLGFMLTPRMGQTQPSDTVWAADNGRFSAPHLYTDDGYLRWLATRDPTDCLFAVAPDVLADHKATVALSRPMLLRIRNAGYRVAFVAQDGWDEATAPWDEFDVLFIGGTTAFKLGRGGDAILAARQRRKPVHMGRVNSYRRLRLAAAVGCSSADGTFLKFGPDINEPRMLRWLDQLSAIQFLPMARSTSVIETIRALQERLDAGEPKKGNGSEGADSR